MWIAIETKPPGARGSRLSFAFVHSLSLVECHRVRWKLFFCLSKCFRKCYIQTVPFRFYIYPGLFISSTFPYHHHCWEFSADNPACLEGRKTFYVRVCCISQGINVDGNVAQIMTVRLSNPVRRINHEYVWIGNTAFLPKKGSLASFVAVSISEPSTSDWPSSRVSSSQP